MRDPDQPDQPDLPDLPDERELLTGFRDVAVTPLPAAEIRARGDRLRRRRTTLTVLGAAASVALVASVVSGLNSPGQQVQPTPAPATASPTPSATAAASADDDQLPADFPIAAGIPEVQGLVIQHDLGASVAVCDKELPDGPVLDVMRVAFEQPRTEDRVLQLYASGAVARAEVEDARAAVAAADCAGSGGYTTLPYDKGDASFAFAESSGYLFRFVTVGRALLFVVTFERRATTVVDSDPLLQPVIEAMTIFSDEEAIPPSGSAIPTDFPLDVDQVAMEGDGGEKRGPSPDETGLNELTLCGAPIFADDPAERLASTATGPEYADMRELRVYPTADEAAEQITMLRARLSTECSQQVDGGGRLVHAPVPVDTGYDTVTWADYYTRGLGGGSVQLTRVGRAVLAVALGGEFSEASLDGAGETVTEVTLKITPAMCVFTEDGCGAAPSEPEYLAMSYGQAGPFVLGMRLSAVRKQATDVDDSSRCATFTWEPDSLPHLTGVVDPDKGVVSLASSDKRFLTAEGVGVGATYDEVREAYPDATGDRSALVAELGGSSYRFELTDDRVTWLALVASDQTCVG